MSNKGFVTSEIAPPVLSTTPDTASPVEPTTSYIGFVINSNGLPLDIGLGNI